MNTRIIRYTIPADGDLHEVPWFPGPVQHVDCRRADLVEVWVLDEHPAQLERLERPADRDRGRFFVVVATGQDWPYAQHAQYDYVGTALSPDMPGISGLRGAMPRGELVWHLLERVQAP